MAHGIGNPRFRVAGSSGRSDGGDEGACLIGEVGVAGWSARRTLERAHTDPRAGDVRDSQADQTSLRSLFPDIEPTPFRDGLQATVDWFETLRTG